MTGDKPRPAGETGFDRWDGVSHLLARATLRPKISRATTTASLKPRVTLARGAIGRSFQITEHTTRQGTGGSLPGPRARLPVRSKHHLGRVQAGEVARR